MSAAQVTEEHIYTLAKVGKAYVAGEDAQAAQLIADSEAKACAELRGALALGQQNCDDVFEDLRNERDQLRAERNNLRADLDAIKAIRAENSDLRAKACQCSYDEACAHVLRAERGKVRALRKALGNVKDSICRNVPDGYSQPCVDESADECDRIIDAAMKEGA